MKPGVLVTCLGVQGDKETSGCSGDVVMSRRVEPERGIEPLTYALRVRCSAD